MLDFLFFHTLVHLLPAFCHCSLGGESEQYSMYPSNRVKRRPAPYEVELDEGRRILDLYKYGKTHFCCVLLLPIQFPKCPPPLISIVINPLTWICTVPNLSVAEDVLRIKTIGVSV